LGLKSTHSAKKKPWPTQAAMRQVYQQHLWGEGDTKFYSGQGSHDERLVNPYIEAASTFLKSFETPLTVCDLGCGDFNIGKQVLQYTKHYIGIDIVPELIARNIQKFQHPDLEFHCLDIAEAELPKADCALLRQVLQHLSNAEVKKIVNKLHNFKYVLLTEHIPQGAFTANKDIVSGQGIRLKKQSGLDVFQAPFDLKVKSQKKILSLDALGFKGCIVTTLLEMF